MVRDNEQFHTVISIQIAITSNYSYTVENVLFTTLFHLFLISNSYKLPYKDEI